VAVAAAVVAAVAEVAGEARAEAAGEAQAEAVAVQHPRWAEVLRTTVVGNRAEDNLRQGPDNNQAARKQALDQVSSRIAPKLVIGPARGNQALERYRIPMRKVGTGRVSSQVAGKRGIGQGKVKLEIALRALRKLNWIVSWIFHQALGLLPQVVRLPVIALLGPTPVIEGLGANNVTNGSTIDKIARARGKIGATTDRIHQQIGLIGVKNEGIMFVILSMTTIPVRTSIKTIPTRPDGV
jgi:hypothetical protein